MNKRAHLTYVNDLETSAIDIADRGLAYGDGLFETLRVFDGEIPLLPFHFNRLARGVKALDLGKPEEVLAKFERYVCRALKELSKYSHLQCAIIKVIVTRGKGGRGYTPPLESELNFITQVFESPNFPVENSSEGISLHLCEHRLSHQPALAGLKHLNRLDQVIASRELLKSGFEEGLMLDYQNQVIEGTKSNILIFEDREIITPNVDKAGVDGTLRQFLLKGAADLGIDIKEQQVSLERLKAAQGMAVVNSVFGLWPVKEFAGKRYAVHEFCGIIQAHLRDKLSY